MRVDTAGAEAIGMAAAADAGAGCSTTANSGCCFLQSFPSSPLTATNS